MSVHQIWPLDHKFIFCLILLDNKGFWEIKDNALSTLHPETTTSFHTSRLVPWASSDTVINGRTGTKRLLKACWLQQEAGGALRFRKASRGMAEPRRAQAWGDGPSLPSHVHKVESELMKEKFYSITWKPCSWLTQVKLVTQNWQISQYFFILELLLPWQREPWDNWAG